MHEWGITESVIKEIIKHVNEHRLEQIDKICLSIGKDSDITTESLKFCFENLSKETILENAKLEIKEGNGRGIVIDSIEGLSRDE